MARIDIPSADTLGVWDATLDLPEQIERARARFRDDADALGDPGQPASVVVFGMGGSGMAGDIATVVAIERSSVPVVVVKDYRCPSWVGAGTLAIAVSFSGDTEETLEAASEARGRGAAVVAVSTGGQLGRLAGDWGRPLLSVEPDIPMPRLAVGAVSVPVLGTLQRMGLVAGVDAELDRAVAQLRRRRDVLTREDSLAERLARRLARTIPLVYGAGALGAVAANRWKNQINENAKAIAFTHALPEATHNELVGWGQHGDVTRQILSLVELRHGHEHGQHGRRFSYVNQVVEEVVHDIVAVQAEGDGALAQLFDLFFVGDLVSVLMAFAEDVDPGPIPVLDDLKTYLAR
jgi:glucose/mannose-6-phosphate isomerase